MLALPTKGLGLTLKALLDSGASNNFIRSRMLETDGFNYVEKRIPPSQLKVRLATGATVHVKKRVVEVHYTYSGCELHDDFVVLDLDDKFDVILGMPWLTKHQPIVDWKRRSVDLNGNSDSRDAVSTIESITPSELSVVACDGPTDTPLEGGTLATVCESPVSESSSDSPGTTSSCCSSEPPTHHNNSCDVVTPFEETLTLNVIVSDGSKVGKTTLQLDSPPTTAKELLELPVLEHKRFLRELRKGDFTQVCMLVVDDEHAKCPLHFAIEECLCSSSSMDESVLDEKTKKERFASQSWESLKSNPLFEDLWEFRDVFPEAVPCELPKDKGTRHEIVLQPGTKYCVTRQWRLPRDQVKAIDEFFESRRKAGHVRESTSPHSSPTFCVRKPTGGWRIVHAYNKLNAATVPAQTPIPRKDVIIDGMSGSTIFSCLDLMDGYYQILMREADIPFTAVSTPSGMLWEWLVMPQGLSNAPATFNRCVSHLLRPVREFAPSYFDDVFVHSRASEGHSDVENHRIHIRKLLTLLREHKLYANLRKCIFAAAEIPVLGCLVGKRGVRVDPEKISAIREWPVPTNVKDLRKFLGMATYLHKYARNFAGLALPLSRLLKKEAEWVWDVDCQRAFDSIRKSLMEAPVLAIANHDKPFYVVCDASDFAIGCALMQRDEDDHERVIFYQSRQLKPAERNYPVHDKELLAMKYALVKFRIYLLGDKPFIVYTDHASLRTAVHSPHLSQRMARWLSFFAEYNFSVEHKPGRFNVIADALSRRPDYELDEAATASSTTVSTIASPLGDAIKAAYSRDKDVTRLINCLKGDPSDNKLMQSLLPSHRASLHRYALHEDLLMYRAVNDDNYRVVVPDDHDLKLRIMFEYHDAPLSGHRGREKTYLTLSRDLYWPNQYKFVRKYIRACEVCQRVKSTQTSRAPLLPLPVPTECWNSVSMDFIFGLPKDDGGNTGILVFVDRFSKMVHLAAVPDTIDAAGSARVFMDTVFRLHGMPSEVISDRDPRFTAKFWQCVFQALGTRLRMSTADHPETDGQTERVNRVLEEILRGYAHSFASWSEHLPMAEFAINNSVHASTSHTPFYVNGLRHPRVPASIGSSQWVPGSLVGNNKSPANTVTINPLINGIPSLSWSESGSDQTISCLSPAEPGSAVKNAPGTDAVVPSGGGNTKSNFVFMNTKDNTVFNMELNAEDQHNSTLNNVELEADKFILIREAINRFVQDSIACKVDKQKENADKNGRANTLSFNVNDLVLLSTSTLPEHAVTCNGSSKLLPKFIGPFRVVRKSHNAYTLDLPRRMRTHPTFYVGRLRPYHSLDDASREAPSCSRGESREHACDPSPASCVPHEAHTRTSGATRAPHAIESASRTTPCRSSGDQERSPDAQSFSSRERPSCSTQSRVEHESREDQTEPPRVQPATSHELFPPPPPPLVDASGNQHWIVADLVDHKDQKTGRRKTRVFRVRWRGYPPSEDTWEPRENLIVDVPDLVADYESNLP